LRPQRLTGSIVADVLPRKAPEPTVDPSTMLDELEQQIELLRVAYDKYFVGIERAAPVRQRERLDRRMRGLEAHQLRTTALRFRCGTLRARYVSYAHYWTRILDQIERGVFRRDIGSRLPAPAPAPVAVAAVDARTSESPAPTALVDPEHARGVFRELIAAKQSVGEPTDGLTFAAFLRKLSREAPKLMEQHPGKVLRFDVEVKGGKVRVRARGE
jgi:hypothetical protein